MSREESQSDTGMCNKPGHKSDASVIRPAPVRHLGMSDALAASAGRLGVVDFFQRMKDILGDVSEQRIATVLYEAKFDQAAAADMLTVRSSCSLLGHRQLLNRIL